MKISLDEKYMKEAIRQARKMCIRDSCWVMHEQAIIDEILGGLDLNGCQVHLFSLICSPKELAGRLEKDIEQGLRDEDVVNRSLARLPFYEKLNTIKIDTTGCSPKMVAERITKASGRKRWDS